MRELTTLDWSIVFAYLAFALLIGALVSRRASRSLESYYVAERNLPWWWLGTSMVATTFAADTPLVVTGLVANHGVAGNWFWWSWAASYVSLAVVFAALWRRARVITDAELIELRYTGSGATLLRGFKAIFRGADQRDRTGVGDPRDVEDHRAVRTLGRLARRVIRRTVGGVACRGSSSAR